MQSPFEKSSLKLDAPGRGRVYNNIMETFANTPMVRLNRLAEERGAKADVLVKLEFFNPLASVKDRIGVAMIEALERDGKIGPGSTIVEPTSGNTGIALAFVCAAKGYRCILTMPDSFSIERRKMLVYLGAELHLTPKEKGIKASIDKAQELVDSIEGAIMPWQFGNPANPAVHYHTTGPEIWRDTDGKVDVFVSGVGTGGTATGVGHFLKEKKPDAKLIVVEPENSQVIAGGEHSPHMIQGIGAGFIPDTLDTEIVDEILAVSNEEALETTKQLALLEAIPGGISSGAMAAAALRVAARDDMTGKTVVTVLPSFAERYMTTPLFDGLDV
ncbi:MAG: cysteine synthase A [Alphaproteobacteria bacterium]|nr:cysteine synthase A [Alphaproteobacteria bacterium]